MAGNVLEGTWEEIARRAPEFVGRRVRLVVLSESAMVGAANPPETLAEALAGLTGVIHSREHTGKQLRLSEDETSFPEVLEQKRREGAL